MHRSCKQSQCDLYHWRNKNKSPSIQLSWETPRRTIAKAAALSPSASCWHGDVLVLTSEGQHHSKVSPPCLSSHKPEVALRAAYLWRTEDSNQALSCWSPHLKGQQKEEREKTSRPLSWKENLKKISISLNLDLVKYWIVWTGSCIPEQLSKIPCLFSSASGDAVIYPMPIGTRVFHFFVFLPY